MNMDYKILAIFYRENSIQYNNKILVKGTQLTVYPF